MSQNTEQNLQRQQKQLSSLKGQFMEHIKRMESSENPSDLKKVQEMKVKLKQVSKILPYLEKYITVNKQAEVQTLTVLKEGCVVRLRELDAKHGRKGSLPGGPAVARLARLEKAQSLPSLSLKIKKRQPHHGEDIDASQDVADRLSPILDQPTPAILSEDSKVDLYEEPAYAPIHAIKPKRVSSDEHYTELRPNKAPPITPPTEQYAELEFKHSGTVGSSEAPSCVEYSTLQHEDRNVPVTQCEDRNVPKEVAMDFSGQAGQDDVGSLVSTSNVSMDLHLAGVEESVGTRRGDDPPPSSPARLSPSPALSQTSLPAEAKSLSTQGDSQTDSSPLVSPSKSAPPPPVKAKPKRPRQVDPVTSGHEEVPRTTSLAERMKVRRLVL